MQELGNYGEYSGAPNTQETYQYARTVLSCATAHSDGRARALLIGGGIANFTNGGCCLSASVLLGFNSHRSLHSAQNIIIIKHFKCWVLFACIRLTWFQFTLRSLHSAQNLIKNNHLK